MHQQYQVLKEYAAYVALWEIIDINNLQTAMLSSKLLSFVQTQFFHYIFQLIFLIHCHLKILEKSSYFIQVPGFPFQIIKGGKIFPLAVVVNITEGGQCLKCSMDGDAQTVK